MCLSAYARHILLPAAALLLIACTPEGQFYSAVQNGDVKTVGSLIAQGKIKDINKLADGSQTALHLAAERNRLEVMKLLIASGANVNQTNGTLETALHISAYYGYLEATRLLIAAGAELDPRHKINALTPLLEAARKNHSDVAKLLIPIWCRSHFKNGRRARCYDIGTPKQQS